MTAMQGALSAAERSMRSVFVGNIPYEATEEQLKDIFAEVGPVVSFRLVYDRETGKPKGYGFCEYKDQEMALSAMRNLNGYELNGRALRVDNAASEKSKEELKNLQASLGGPPVESPYGPEVPPEEAPDAIAKVVSSLPPEQLYELMIQMKQCIDSNPNEARVLLMQNPQLSYALLQAQVIMKIVDPIQAKAMLHSQNPFVMSASALLPTPEKTNTTQAPPILPGLNDGPPTFPPAMPQDSTPPTTNSMPQRPLNPPPARPSLLGDRPVVPTNQVPPPPFPDHSGLNARPMGDHDLRQMPMADRDMRPPPLMGVDKDMRHQPADEDFRSMTGPGRMPEPRPMDSRYPNAPPNMPPHGDIRNINSGDMRNMPPGNMRNMPPGDMRNMPPTDMRGMPSNDMHRMGQPQGRGMPPNDPHSMPPVGGRNMPPNDPHGMQSAGVRNMPPNDPHGMQSAGVRNMPPNDLHGMQSAGARNMPPNDPHGMQSAGARNMPPNPAARAMPPIGGRGMPLADPSNRGPMFDRPPAVPNFEGHRPPASGRMDDHRNPVGPMNPSGIGARPPQNPRLSAVGNESPAMGGGSPNPAPSPRSNNALAAAAAAIAPHDQEKAALIMQVLQLSDQQIAMLPQEQRQSILILKEQIARSQATS